MSVIEIDLKIPNKLPFVVDLLQSLDFVEKVRIRDDSKVSGNASFAKKEVKIRLSDKYWGAWENKLTNDDIDSEIHKMRNEWQRDIY